MPCRALQPAAQLTSASMPTFESSPTAALAGETVASEKVASSQTTIFLIMNFSPAVASAIAYLITFNPPAANHLGRNCHSDLFGGL